MREDLPEIIRLGRKKGFGFFQLNTNGLRLAAEPGYAKALREAGLDTVFLQFDGLDDRVYQILRGRPLLEEKRRALEACAAAGLGAVLVPVIAPGVNEGQGGGNYPLRSGAYARRPGGAFSAISYFGRCALERRPQAHNHSPHAPPYRGTDRGPDDGEGL